MYVCGVTVYDYSHIGHARVYVAFDTLFRLLKDLGFDVTYVRNFTDIDDKIIRRAQESGRPWKELTETFIRAFHVDMAALGCLAPTIEPRATDHIAEMITMIERIIGNGHGYELEGDVYFDIASLPEYGALSGRRHEDNRPGERVAVDDRKRSPADFALWKASKPGEPFWDSPWGPGRPGWHIECSAMIAKTCGPAGVDIHGGGRDLIFPHHENERAQSIAASCTCCKDGKHQDLARFWVHNGFVNVESEKMSKSLGNFFTIRDVLRTAHPAALRWFLLSTHYRTGLNFSARALDQAMDRVYYLFQTLEDADAALKDIEAADLAHKGYPEPTKNARSRTSKSPPPKPALIQAVRAALCEDLNTATALAALQAGLREMNDLVGTRAGRRRPDRGVTLRRLRADTAATLSLLGLDLGAPGQVLEELRAAALKAAGLSKESVSEAVARRAALRAAGDYAGADAVRTELAARGIALMDGSGSATAWRPLPRHAAEQD